MAGPSSAGGRPKMPPIETGARNARGVPTVGGAKPIYAYNPTRPAVRATGPAPGTAPVQTTPAQPTQAAVRDPKKPMTKAEFAKWVAASAPRVSSGRTTYPNHIHPFQFDGSGPTPTRSGQH